MGLERGISLASFVGLLKAVGLWGATERDAGWDGQKGLTVELGGGRKGEASSGYAI